jgi:hypothetical protein
MRAIWRVLISIVMLLYSIGSDGLSDTLSRKFLI